MTVPQPLPKRFLHLMPSRASSFKWEYPLLSQRSSSNFLRLLPRLLDTSIRPFIFPSITSFRRQFLRKMWPIQLAFRFLISCRIKCIYQEFISGVYKCICQEFISGVYKCIWQGFITGVHKCICQEFISGVHKCICQVFISGVYKCISP
jgi:hypothetical protein